MSNNPLDNIIIYKCSEGTPFGLTHIYNFSQLNRLNVDLNNLKCSETIDDQMISLIDAIPSSNYVLCIAYSKRNQFTDFQIGMTGSVDNYIDTSNYPTTSKYVNAIAREITEETGLSISSSSEFWKTRIKSIPEKTNRGEKRYRAATNINMEDLNGIPIADNLQLKHSKTSNWKEKISVLIHGKKDLIYKKMVDVLDTYVKHEKEIYGLFFIKSCVLKDIISKNNYGKKIPVKCNCSLNNTL